MARRRFSFDFGFRFTKIFPGGNIADTKLVPTAIGNATTTNAAAEYGHCFDSAAGVAGSFSTGHYAVKYSDNPTNRQDRGWFRDPAFLKVFYGAIVEAGVKDGEEIDIVVCIPIDDKGYAQNIKDVLTGEHSYTLRGQRPVTFTVCQTFVALQGISAFYHFYLNLNGKPKLDLSGQKIYLIECGGNTFHEVMFDGYTDIEDATKSHYNMGFWNVINDVHQWLTHEHSVDVNILRVAEFVEQRRCFVDGDIDLTEIVNNSIQTHGKKHTDIISKRRDFLRIVNHLPVAGGAGKLFLPCYQEVNPRFLPLPNPQYANVVGAYKLSVMI